MNLLTVYDNKDLGGDSIELQIESAVTLLELPEVKLTEKQIKRFRRSCKKLGISLESFEPSDLDELKSLVKAIQKQVVLDNHQILSQATIRDLASLTSSITSLLRLFTATQKTIDYAKDYQSLHEGVIAAISALSEEDQQPFWRVIQDPVHGFVDAPKGGDSHG